MQAAAARWKTERAEHEKEAAELRAALAAARRKLHRWSLWWGWVEAFGRDSTARWRQSDAAFRGRGNLPPSSVLLWFDSMQNISLPLAHTETGDVLYGTDRMEATVFGAHLAQNRVGPRLQAMMHTWL